MEAAHLPIEGMCVTRELTRVHTDTSTNHQTDLWIYVSRTQTTNHILRAHDFEANQCQGAGHSLGSASDCELQGPAGDIVESKDFNSNSRDIGEISCPHEGEGSSILGIKRKPDDQKLEI